MRNQGQLFVGGVLILLGFSFLLGTVFNVNVWAFFWPVVLILLGGWILLRPQFIPGTPIHMMPLGEIRRDGAWQVANEEFWFFVGDAEFDLTRAEVPAGETTLRFFGFVAEITLIVPQGVGVAVSSTAFVTELKVQGKQEESFVMPYHYATEDYVTSDRKLRLETAYFVASIKIMRP